MSRPTSSPLGAVLVILAALLFAANGVTSKLAMQAGISPTRLVELRIVASAVLIVAVALAVAPRSLRIRGWRDLAALALLGVIGMAMLQWLYFVAISRMPVGLALLIEFTAPILVALWARFVLREQISSRLWWGLAASLVGLTMVAQVGRGAAIDSVGLAAAVGSAVALAAYFLLSDRMMRGRAPLSLQAWGMVFAALFWIVLQPLWTFDTAVLSTAVDLPAPLDGPTPPLWLLVLVIAVLGTVVPYLLILSGIRRIGAARAALIGMLEPACAAVFAWIFLDESMTALQVAGGLVVLLGVALAESSRRTQIRRQVPPADVIVT